MDSAEGRSWVLGLRSKAGRRDAPEADLLWTPALRDHCRKGVPLRVNGGLAMNDKVKCFSVVILIMLLLEQSDT